MSVKRVLAFVLSLLLLIGLVPTGVLADGEDDDTYGNITIILGGGDENPPSTSLTNGYYLIGKTIWGDSNADWNYCWSIESLDASRLFTYNSESEENEYYLNITLNEDEQFKVVRVENNSIVQWYPSTNNYRVYEDYAGDNTVYFRPNYNGGEGWIDGCIYVPALQPQGDKYLVDVTDITLHAGNVTAIPTRAVAGQTVTLSVTEFAGYKLRANYPTVTGSQPWQTIQTQKTDNRLVVTFTMPAHDVYVHAYFDEAKVIQVNTYDMSSGHQVASNAGGTVSITPTSGFDGDIVTATITTNPGYNLDDLYTTEWTLVSQDDNVYVYEIPVMYGNINVYFTQRMMEGYYLQIGEEADYTKWIRLPKLKTTSPTFFGSYEGVCSAKAELTAGQTLAVYELTYDGETLRGIDTPLATYTVTADDVVEGHPSTVYYNKNDFYDQDIHVSVLNGYYLVFNTKTPYDIVAANQLVEQSGGVYVNDGYYTSGNRVRVAEYQEGTVVQTYLNGNTNVQHVPAEFATETYGESTYGRAWFYPAGDEDAYPLGGYVKMARLYRISVDEEVTSNCTIAGDVNVYKVAGDTATFGAQPHNGTYTYRIASITVTDAAGEELQLTDDPNDARIHSFIMPASDVAIAVITEQRYVLYIQQTEGATVTPNTYGGYAGDDVILTVELALGYALDEITATYVDGAGATQSLAVVQDQEDETKWTLTMPAFNVTLAYAVSEHPPIITTQPLPQTVDEGAQVTFTLVARDAESYQWQYLVPEAEEWINVAEECDAATLTFVAAPADNGKQYRCLVTNFVGTVNSSEVALTVNLKPVITTQPLSVTIDEDQEATFTVVAADAESYQWQYLAPEAEEWADVAVDGTAASYTVVATGANNGNTYRCQVTNDVGSVLSDEATLTVNLKPIITTQPLNVSASEGETAVFTVVATGADSYRWQYQKPGSTTWSNVKNNGAADTYGLAVEERHNGYKYRCKLDNDVGTVYTDEVLLTVVPKNPPIITTQPVSVIAAEGEAAVFTVVATGADTVQWQYKKPGSSTWSTVKKNGTDYTYTLTTEARHDGYSYRCKLTNGKGTTYSNVVTLTVDRKEPPVITTQPVSVTVALGAKATFTVVATGAGSYRWQYLKPGSTTWSNVSSNGTSSSYTLTTESRHNGYQYRCKVNNATGSASVYTDIVTLTVGILPVITTQPKAVTVYVGKTATFKVVATDATSYRWQYLKPGETTWTNVSKNGTSDIYSLTTAAKHDGYTYRCQVKNASGTVTSKAVKLTVSLVPVITTQPKAKTVTAGEKATFKVVADGAESYQWQYQKPGSTTWTDVSKNGTSASYSLTTAAKHNGYTYRCKVTNAKGSVYTKAVKLTVN